MDFGFYKDKKVFVTGHTGFKGTWLCEILCDLGATVIGYSLEPPTEPALFQITEMDKRIKSNIGDVRNLENMVSLLAKEEPEIVIHMAAQPLVRESYENPVYTYETNVLGTVNLLECVRKTKSVKSLVNVTTDKVYENKEWSKPYKETDRLDGYDPYSNSKSCSELITHCYQQSFLKEAGVAISTCRAGNVIGGGDFSKDRIIPDCVRGARQKRDIVVRNPYSIRPYQHVLEPLFAYLMIAMEQYKNAQYAGCYNVGPNSESCIATGELVQLFCNAWMEGQKWISGNEGGPHEANFLQLDSAKLRNTFGWKPKWNIEQSVKKVVEWEKAFQKNDDVVKIMRAQILEYNNA